MNLPLVFFQPSWAMTRTHTTLSGQPWSIQKKQSQSRGESLCSTILMVSRSGYGIYIGMEQNMVRGRKKMRRKERSGAIGDDGGIHQVERCDKRRERKSVKNIEQLMWGNNHVEAK